MKRIYIFNNASRAANYGIGTYVKQLTEGFNSMPDTEVSLVEMFADTKEFNIIFDDRGFRHFLIPPIKSYVETENYCRIIFYFLARNMHFEQSDQVIFQFNYFQHYFLALLLKSKFPKSRIVVTVHYLNWCFELNGNVSEMRGLMVNGFQPSNEKERKVIASILSEQKFLHLADDVVALSNNTRDIIVNDYNVSSAKLSVIYNGILDHKIDERGHDLGDARNILFLGRLDEIKGIKYLIKAFEEIAVKHNDVRLIIVGDGDFQKIMELSRTMAHRISFMGKMNHEDLESIYQSSHIGVMPSFHEQCSYTAIEMMTHGIPIIATDSTGLGEMLDYIPELRIHIDEENFEEEDFISQIANRLDLLLSDSVFFQKMSEFANHTYKDRYTLERMIGSMNSLFDEYIMDVDSSGMSLISPDFYNQLDSRMIGLINQQPDIDTDVYGITGIGIYLWWRVLNLEKEHDCNQDKIALIKEHLIYYLDWIGLIGEVDVFPGELLTLLEDMKSKSFYITKVIEILKSLKINSSEENHMLDEDIVLNAMRIFVSKV